MGEWGRVSKDTVKGQRTDVKDNVLNTTHTHTHTHTVCDGVGVGWEVSQSEGG